MKHFLYQSKFKIEDIVRRLTEERVECRKIKDLKEIDRLDRADTVVFIDAAILEGKGKEKAFAEKVLYQLNQAGVRLILLGGKDIHKKLPQTLNVLVSVISKPLDETQLYIAIGSAFKNIELSRTAQELKQQHDLFRRDLQVLKDVGVALSAERDIDTLLNMILQESRKVTYADAGSLYIIETDEKGEKRLRFKLSHTDSLKLDFKEFTLPLNKNSMAGYVAVTGKTLNFEDVYNIPPGSEVGFNKSFDQSTGYRTKSMLVIPMKDHKDKILGVIQLINRKRDASLRLVKETFESETIPFDSNCEELVSSLASQAAVSLENNILYKNIETLFEGFVMASVTAIESRDPTTSGHSSRVALLTVGLAEKTERTPAGIYKEIKFTKEQLREMRYASLLHDFGKVGVREQVLVKAKKMFDQQFIMVKDRFEFVKKNLEAQFTKKKLDYILEHSREKYMEEIGRMDEEFIHQMKMVDDHFQFILQANEPTVLETGGFDKLKEIANFQFIDLYNKTQNLLTDEEVKVLSIPRGSLTEQDRLDIESHVTHTYHFLRQIPWTTDLNWVPKIAYMHHEKLDGSGYPNKVKSDEIPLQSKMMTISDIYDALTASDRPYKRAVPRDKALDILGYEQKAGKVDAELLRIFIEARVFEEAEKWQPAAA